MHFVTTSQESSYRWKGKWVLINHLLPGYAAVAAAIPENFSSSHLSVISFKMAT